MLCASCASALEVEGSDHTRDEQPCPHCHGPRLLDGRYRLMEQLGAHGIGITYHAIHIEEQREVAIKELLFGRMDSFKSQELFEREARVLKELEHAGIPTYLEDFVWGIGKHQAHYLVEELIHGQTLAQELLERRYDEREILRMIEAICRILTYLHTRSPPIIHRDLKPENVMRRPDGSLVLLDFGAVKDAPQEAVGGVTIAGTFGYMAPEQLMGQANARSDLYALGVMAITMLTRKSPIELLDERHELQWSLEHISAPTQALLGMLTARDQRARPVDATNARRAARAARKALSSPQPTTGALVSRGSTELERSPQQESIFGVVCLMLGVPLLSLPCMIMVIGWSNTIIFSSGLLLLAILSIPFLPERLTRASSKDDKGQRPL